MLLNDVNHRKNEYFAMSSSNVESAVYNFSSIVLLFSSIRVAAKIREEK